MDYIRSYGQARAGSMVTRSVIDMRRGEVSEHDRRAFMFNWLRGTPCWKHPHTLYWVSPCGCFIIAKHEHHKTVSVLHTAAGSAGAYCGTYYALYDLRTGHPAEVSGVENACGHDKALDYWPGRWKRMNSMRLEERVGYPLSARHLPVGRHARYWAGASDAGQMYGTCNRR